jgi:amino acid transporter
MKQQTHNTVDFEVVTDGPAQRFGTFLGVYLPSVLTILGVMMYLRFGWVVGNTGMPLALLIVMMASSITFVTGLSASAVATNMRVGVGGEYYMVSRSLGLELGGAIGIPLFLCRTLSMTLYAFGLAESLSFLWPGTWGDPPLQWMAAVIILLITAIAGKSAALSLKLQIPIMVAVGLSMLALGGGVATGGFVTPEMAPSYQRSAPGGFWYVYAVFFPAVTGFTAGIGMSGDLKDPKRAIPRGTLLAVVTGTLSYLTILALLSISARISGPELAVLDPKAPPIWTKIALGGFWLVYPGMWGAILSSAFGSALSGPRVLQALSNDGLAPRSLARTSRTGQPTIATWVAGGIALAAVALGDLNAVGSWVTIFFLTLYVTINLAAALENLVGDPSYRPTIRVPWFVSLAGSLGAVAMMFMINRWACLAAVVLESVLYLHLRRKALRSRSGDVRAGLWTALARFALLQLRQRSLEARNWRPQILLFTANPSRRMDLVRMANWFNQNRGVVTVCQVLVGDLNRAHPEIQERLQVMDEDLDKEGLVAFSEVDIVPEFEPGVIGIAQANGIAGLQSNTLMFGWPDDPRGVALLLRVMRTVSYIEKSTILAKLPREEVPRSRQQIDIWWRGMQHNGDMMLLLAHLLTNNADWRRARVTLRTIIGDEAELEENQQRLDDLVQEARIQAHTDLIVKPPDRTVQQVMFQASQAADVVFLGLKIPEPEEDPTYAESLMKMADGFSATIFVRHAGPFAGQLIET